MRRLNIFLLVMLLLIGVPYWWLLVDNRHPPVQPHPLPIASLRTLARAMPGPRPLAIEGVAVARRTTPGTLLAAGIGISEVPLVATVWRLPVAGGAPILINAGMTAAQAAVFAFPEYDAAVQALVTRELGRASHILATNEHAEHLGGLAALIGRPEAAWAFAHARLPAAQRRDNPKQLMIWPKGMPATPADSRPYAVAPGVVVIPAPSHSPGSQMIFVTTADGREYLFTGDISPLDINWREQRGRARLLGQFHIRQDRQQIYAWLASIEQLVAQAPKLIVVPGHDGFWLDRAWKAGLVRRGFGE